MKKIVIKDCVTFIRKEFDKTVKKSLKFFTGKCFLNDTLYVVKNCTVFTMIILTTLSRPRRSPFFGSDNFWHLVDCNTLQEGILRFDLIVKNIADQTTFQKLSILPTFYMQHFLRKVSLKDLILFSLIKLNLLAALASWHCRQMNFGPLADIVTI
jgi:hypothetical protein